MHCSLSRSTLFATSRLRSRSPSLLSFFSRRPLSSSSLFSRSMSSSTSYDVIISGAGPVGLFLACELRQAKCSVLVLEKAATPESDYKVLPFGLRGLNSISVEAFYRRNLLHEFELQAKMMHMMRPKPAGALTGQKGPGGPPSGPPTGPPSGPPSGLPSGGPPSGPPSGGPPRGGMGQGAGFFGGVNSAVEPDTSQWKYRLPSSTDSKWFTELREVETILHRRAASLGVEVRHGMALTDFQQAADGVSVEAGGETFKGQWLVGCDGARSEVRRKGGFEYEGTEPEMTGYSTQVELADPEKLKPGRVLTGQGLYWQLFPGYVIIQDFDGGAAHVPGQAPSHEQVQEVLHRVSGTNVTITKLIKSSTWTDRSRQATTYRNGRVFLAGDAAHIHSPLGGQGLNLGIGDALNLGWKLAATIQGRAPAGLLDTYYSERYPVGEQVLDWSRAQIMSMKPGPYGRALSGVMRDLVNTKDGATYLASRLTGVLMHYDFGGTHPLVGYSVPNFELEDGTKAGELLHDGRAMLLDFGSNDTLKAIAAEYGEQQVRYVSGRAKEQKGVSAVLVRPDGFVAWASDSDVADEQVVRQAAASWLTPSSGVVKQVHAQ